MTSYLPEQIEELLNSNPEISLGSIKYTGPGGKGGCKELLINGEVISVVIPCETNKLETTHRFKVIFFVSQSICEQITSLCEYISNSLDTRMRPFCWEYNKEGSTKTSYYASGKLLTSKDGKMYTKLYTPDGELMENPQEWPTTFSGHVSLRLDGVYIDNFKSRETKVSFVVTVEEVLVTNVQENDKQGSKIKKLLTSFATDEKEISSDSEDLW